MPDAKTEPAVVFDDESHTGTDLVHFGDSPGVFMPDEPVAVSELEYASEKDAADRVKELGLPLKKTTVTVGKGKAPARENHALSEDEARAAADTPKPAAEAKPDEPKDNS
jgi:hypothetical protein